MKKNFVHKYEESYQERKNKFVEILMNKSKALEKALFSEEEIPNFEKTLKHHSSNKLALSQIEHLKQSGGNRLRAAS